MFSSCTKVPFNQLGIIIAQLPIERVLRVRQLRHLAAAQERQLDVSSYLEITVEQEWTEE